MRRAMAGGTLGVALAPPGCGPGPRASWKRVGPPRGGRDSLALQRGAGGDPDFAPLASEDPARLRETTSALLSSRPTSPEAAMRGIPDYAPVARPAVDAAAAAPAASPPRARTGSSTPPSVLTPQPPAERARVSAPLPPVREPEPPAREATRAVTVPGQPPGMVSGTGRIQTYTQPGNPAGGVAIQDGGNTTIIQPGGRVTTVPTPR